MTHSFVQLDSQCVNGSPVLWLFYGRESFRDLISADLKISTNQVS